ncbi:hypothetical protein [Nocardioides daphniae]|uniref:Uncharacterized protein n=1 Tax=Nocardioides daphniae TaxID=402297 RepID=A0A4P7UBA3_9ACTN|nr:hypothetical protein [Nocardioides daphniae]QCC77246.1 hypothetical protein E2C04_08605 [Nocardioides daphniae]GGD26255.1 hypothetical protein GCM10007231_27070 [Nocardioides daphniae]
MSITTSRRGLLTASAWAVPAIMVSSASPAFAGSGVVPPPTSSCREIDYTFSWQASGYSFVPTSSSSLYGVGKGSAPATRVPNQSLTPAEVAAITPLTVTASNSFTGNRMRGRLASDGAANMRVSPFNVGGLQARGLTLLQDLTTNNSLGNNAATRAGHAQVLKLEFSRPVKNLRFTITDIDSTSGQYRDRVSVSGGASGVRATALRGAGTASDPWRNNSDNTGYDPGVGSGNVAVDYSGLAPVSTVLVTFWNDQSGSLSSYGLQGIFISNLTFRAMSC